MIQLELNIVENLGSYTIEQLSTLKASSSFVESWYMYDKKNVQQKRAAEAVRPLLKGQNTTKAIQLLSYALEKVESQGAMHVCIFKVTTLRP